MSVLVPDYNKWTEYYDTKYFNNNREEQWVPYSVNLYGKENKQEHLNFYYNNQEFIENHKKAMNQIHMAWTYMFFKPASEWDEKCEDEIQNITTFKYGTCNWFCP